MRTSKITPASFIWKICLSAIAAAIVPLTAHAASTWWDQAWHYRKKITLDTTPAGAGIAEPIGTATVLLRLHDGDFQFQNALQDGSDLRFVATDDKTLLGFHIEKFDTLFNEALVWVKVPDIKPGAATSFWLYSGNEHPTTGGADPKASYDADTVLVYHFNDHGQAAADATSNANNAKNPGTPVDGSYIGAGVRFDGPNAVTIASSPSLVWTRGGNFTWSAWVKIGLPKANAAIFSRSDGAGAFVMGADQSIPFVSVRGANGVSQRSAPGAPLVPNSWHHLAAVSSGTMVTLFVDGESYAAIDAVIPALDSPLVLGGEFADTGASTPTNGFVGEMDEVELSRIARPAGFVKLGAFEQSGDRGAKALSIVDDVQPKGFLSGLMTGYVGIILGSLSVDGWIVIGILAVMAVISWMVMFGKASYLRRVGKGNDLFLEQWSHVATDLDKIESGGGDTAKGLGGAGKEKERVMRKAPLYRIYHIGVEEIHHRLAADKKNKESGSGKLALSSRSIQAIRASLDGGLVRETQRLNSQMVLLTIAISGGPFLGLLGTVVGVMITFAAVAAAGDVNVNAIAPGIAAALAATVAGLGVAIPSLFGYNYLLTQIKSATTHMHVFIDEFVTKMAEHYSETAE